MRVYITAVAGYIGTYLLQYLHERGGYQISGCDIRSFPPLMPKLEGVQFALLDCTRLRKEDLEGYDAVIHLAAVSSHADANANPRLTQRLNVWGTANLAKVAREAGVKCFIFPSTSAVYQQPLGHEGFPNEEIEVQPVDLYSHTKLQAEEKIQALSSENFRVVILRFGTVYGYSPRMRWDILVNIFTKQAMLEGVLTLYDGGEAYRPLVFIADVARSYEWALNTPIQGVFNISEGDYTVKQVAEIFCSHVTAKEIALNVLPNTKPQEVMSYKLDTSKAEAHGFGCRYRLNEVLPEELRKFSRRVALRIDD